MLYNYSFVWVRTERMDFWGAFCQITQKQILEVADTDFSVLNAKNKKAKEIISFAFLPVQGTDIPFLIILWGPDCQVFGCFEVFFVVCFVFCWDLAS